MLKCIITNVYGVENEYEISEGAVFTENYNETLDSGTILIQQLPSEIDIEPYDIVEIEDDDNKINARRMCIDSYTKTQTSLNPPIFKYEIKLFSETKLLETIICPSLSITKLEPKSADPLNPVNPLRSVYYYINQYVDLYGTKTDYDLTDITFTNKYSLDSRVYDKFNSIVCPEMQWNNPTLREVLNDLMMVADCIPVLHNNVIDYIDLSVVGNEITAEQKSYINYIQEEQSSDDYVSDIKMHLVNAANNTVPSGTTIPSDSTSIVEKIGFRNNESYLLTTENILLQTSYPIWKLFYCKMYFTADTTIQYTYPTPDTTLTLDHDLLGNVVLKDNAIDYIPEYAEWLTKNVFYGAWGSVANIGEYRNTCLYYVRGGKNIYNFNAKYESSVLFIENTQYLFQKIIESNQSMANLRIAAQEYLDSIYPDGNAQLVDIAPQFKTFKECDFEVKYEPIDDFVFSASKIPAPRHKRQIIDNQTNSYVDINKQGMLEYFKANRLGNKMVLINGRYTTNESAMPSLSEKINDKIIFTKQISVYNAYINANYYATDNYVLQNYFTGVKSKIRSWRVVSGQEALLRSELIKFYINSNIQGLYSDYYKVPKYANMEDYISYFKYCCIQFRTNNMLSDESYYPALNIKPWHTTYGSTLYDTNGLQVEFTKHIIRDKNNNVKSVVFTIRMNDNYYNGNYVSNYDGTNHRAEQKGIAYTDNNGEILGGFICFYNNKSGNFSDEYVNRGLKPLTNMGMNTSGTGTGTIFSSNDLVAKIPFIVHKDNKEILQISIQFEYNEEADDMILGKEGVS